MDVLANISLTQVVPDDNSCLFSSIAMIFEQDIAKAPKMRQSEFDVSSFTLFAEFMSNNNSRRGRDKERRRNLQRRNLGVCLQMAIL